MRSGSFGTVLAALLPTLLFTQVAAAQEAPDAPPVTVPPEGMSDAEARRGRGPDGERHREHDEGARHDRRRPPPDGGHGPHAPAGQPGPLAGFHGGVFYLRDRDDNFRLYVQGRMQIDSYNYFGHGVPDTGLKSTIFIRRLRPELTGEFLQGQWQFMLAGDWGATGNDNTDGRTETQAAPPGSAPSAATARYASAQTPVLRAQATDAYLNYRAMEVLQIQVGEFDAPFTMDNRTSDKFIPFMERSLAARAVAVPFNKDIGLMVWGQTEDKLLYYSVGAFNGDGQNRINPDNRADFMGRVFVHPLAKSAGAPLKDLQVGASFRYGRRDSHYVNYDFPLMTTQGNFTFWSPVYAGSKGRTHVIPSAAQTGLAGELRVPVSDFDFTSEFIYVNYQTRESVEGFQTQFTERYGAMKGYSYYAQLGWWPVGKRDVNGLPGYIKPTRVDLSKPDPKDPPRALQVVVKWEQVALKYSSASRGGAEDAKGIDGDIKVNAVSAGVNYWATKHVRLTANYVLNMMPGSAPVAPSTPGGPQQDASQRAVSPANTLQRGVRDDARDTAHSHHEVLFRAAVAFLSAIQRSGLARRLHVGTATRAAQRRGARCPISAR